MFSGVYKLFKGPGPGPVEKVPWAVLRFSHHKKTSGSRNNPNIQRVQVVGEPKASTYLVKEPVA
jgi:hypothetical protein